MLTARTRWHSTALTGVGLFLTLLVVLDAWAAQGDGTARTARGFATGFGVDPDGLFVTSLHVVAMARTVTVSCRDDVRQAVVVGSASAHDLAILKTTGSRPRAYLRFADPKSVRIGARVFTIGFPTPGILGPEPKFTEGTISGLSGLGQGSLLQISVPIQPGNSGGALVNEHGEVVGVIVAQLSDRFFAESSGSSPQNVNFAVKSEHATTLFPRAATGSDAAWLLGTWQGQEGPDSPTVNPVHTLQAAHFEFIRLEGEIQWTKTGRHSAAGVTRRVSETKVELVGFYKLADGARGPAVEYQLERRDNTLRGYGMNASGDRLAATLRKVDAKAQRRVEINRSAAIQRAIDATCLVTVEE